MVDPLAAGKRASLDIDIEDGADMIPVNKVVDAVPRPEPIYVVIFTFTCMYKWFNQKLRSAETQHVRSLLSQSCVSELHTAIGYSGPRNQ